MSNFGLLTWLQDLEQHPEKSKWYRDNVLFPSIEKRYFGDMDDTNPNEWKIEIPIISMDF